MGTGGRTPQNSERGWKPQASQGGASDVFLLGFFLLLLFFFFFFKFSHLFIFALGLCCCTGFSLVLASGSYSLLWCMGFSLQQLLSLQGTGSWACGFQQLWHMGSEVAAPSSRAQAQ